MRKFLFTLLCIFACSLGFSQQNPDEQLAIQYYKDAEYIKANELFEKINLTKRNAYLYYYHFQTLYEIRDFDKLEKLVRKMMKMFPEQQRYNVDLAYVYEISNQAAKAEKEYQSALKNLTAKDYNIRELYSSFLSKAKREYAIEALQRGRKLLNNNKLYIKEICSVYKQLGLSDKMFDEALTIVSDNDPQYLSQAEEIIQDALSDDETKQKYLTIRTLLQKNIQKYPDNNNYMSLLFWVYQINKDFPEALVLAKAMDKKYKEGGERLIQLANLALQNRDYETSVQALNYVIAKGPSSSQYNTAVLNSLDIKFDKITHSFPVKAADLFALETDYHKHLESNGLNNVNGNFILQYASLLAFYLNKTEEAIKLLEDATANSPRDNHTANEFKVKMADIQLYMNNVWDATLLYSQVDKDMPNDTIGQTAKFKNAKLSFYIGEFEWAKSQLDVLRAATSKLIANDAMYFSLLISDNEEATEDEEDTLLFAATNTNIPLKMYARADFLLFQNKIEEAYSAFDSVITLAPFGTLVDDALYQKALILIKKKEFLSAERLLKTIEESHSTELLADDALFQLGDLYEFYIHDSEKAMESYRKLMRDFPSSIYSQEARNRFRNLRGDTN